MSSNFLTSKKPQSPDTVIEVYEDDLVTGLLDNLTPVIVAICVFGISPALNKEPHRQFGVNSRIGRTPDVNEETVFGHHITDRLTHPHTKTPELIQ